MTRDTAKRMSRYRRALATCALAVLWLTIVAIGALATGGAPSALAHGASNLTQQSIPLHSPAATGSPEGTATPVDGTPTAGATRTASPTRAPTKSSFTPGPQPTRVSFSQPTVGASARFDSPGIAGAPDGPSGLVIATITSCITALLALITTVIAFSVLRRGGYAPFLRTLLLGKRAAKRDQSRARGRRDERRTLGAEHNEVNRPYARGAGGRYRDGDW